MTIVIKKFQSFCFKRICLGELAFRHHRQNSLSTNDYVSKSLFISIFAKPRQIFNCHYFLLIFERFRSVSVSFIVNLIVIKEVEELVRATELELFELFELLGPSLRASSCIQNYRLNIHALIL